MRLRRSVCYSLVTATYLLVFYYSFLSDFTVQQTEVKQTEV